MNAGALRAALSGFVSAFMCVLSNKGMQPADIDASGHDCGSAAGEKQNAHVEEGALGDGELGVVHGSTRKQRMVTSSIHSGS